MRPGSSRPNPTANSVGGESLTTHVQALQGAAPPSDPQPCRGGRGTTRGGRRGSSGRLRWDDRPRPGSFRGPHGSLWRHPPRARGQPRHLVANDLRRQPRHDRAEPERPAHRSGAHHRRLRLDAVSGQRLGRVHRAYGRHAQQDRRPPRHQLAAAARPQPRGHRREPERPARRSAPRPQR